ncbi:DEKNAAC101594 [Brettanomyces naardenensis]|uniref:Glycosylphosphatidylinositol anchor biosynthesis protein 11 n=1 Tax=Brettanomyces naardenensis TaxID=13370 RepID=A0A448YIB3_BRENA|nr:DEKNAAC101594 [Brettanomyces naardenensis]
MKKAKKVSFSKERKEYQPGQPSEVVTDIPSDSSDKPIEDLWESPGRNITDSPKPSIFTPNGSFVLIPLHLLVILYLEFTYFNIQSNVDGALLKGLYLLASCQFIYGILVTVNTNRSRKVSKKNKKAKVSSSFNSGDLLGLIFALVLSILSSIPLFITFILFGAPIGSYTLRTFLLALHTGLITVLPMLCTYRLSDSDFKVDWANILTFQVDKFYKNQIYSMAIGGMIGCWLGVIPIPLDWDRPWQAWPITLLGGMYLGGVVGNAVGWLGGKLPASSEQVSE